ncbi:CobQ/CobB/MinD/ParA nucleotide binding domain protein [Leptospira borgpetersenii str. 200801926]|uniref:CobQ/CobB/MinD/ParA nucleotide binding domain protein n=1 Tax=Leptospira borgpetersenii str. 200801926 TaxID=1193009 RepID=A0ABP2S551_LEPBO|nr:CobQ/CobB/MinD/ParA nucleotide binding domain protein [Leptospira borgpetersenii str. 200801926]
MNTVKELIQKIKDVSAKKPFQFHFEFRFPYIYLSIISLEFQSKEDEERESLFANWLQCSIGDLRKLFSRGLILPSFLTENKGVPTLKRSAGDHWLAGEFDIVSSQDPISRDGGDGLRIIHFYGFKGGQARSTILGTIAKSMASEGWKVLVVDADLEAPSLDILFGRRTTQISGTLLGLYLSEDFGVERVYTSQDLRTPGYVDLLPCKPDGNHWDIEFAAFLLKASSDPEVIHSICNTISIEAKSQKYDAILIDHRSGLSNMPLLWMREFSGPVVVASRLDQQWNAGVDFLRSLFRTNSELPGVIVSWRSDNEDPKEYKKRNQDQIEDFLGMLSTEDPDSEETEDLLMTRWIEWPYDSSFRYNRLPDPSSVNQDLKSAIYQIRSELNLSTSIKIEPESFVTNPSGATDKGLLIHTKHLTDLLSPNNGINYIFGRKGTGKTRLYKELVLQNQNLPLLSANDSELSDGIKANDSEVSQAAELLHDKPDKFWWSMISAGLLNQKERKNNLREVWKKEFQKGKEYDFLGDILSFLNDKSEKFTFLFDGVETAFENRYISTYIDSLFRILNSVEYDSKINKYINVKLFLRTDLRLRGTQNIEQQIYGKTIYLYWDTKSILNFLVSRISGNSWFIKNFPAEIGSFHSDISRKFQEGLMIEPQECEEILKKFFPESIPKLKLFLMTFIKNYFSDATGTTDSELGLTYYPRVYDSFINFISDPSTIKHKRYAGDQIDSKTKKVSGELMVAAHEAASRDYLEQVQEELNNLIGFNSDLSKNKTLITKFLNAFNGEKTPFDPKIISGHLEDRLSAEGIKKGQIESALVPLKDIGIFEDYPKDPSRWRVGKLFKHSLGMKFSRGK